ncbi:MAG: hypothetical protein U9Q07_03960 [Planctomycetota bacterium]|nr:hypothetical protein [Planctomycetota bacterium]
MSLPTKPGVYEYRWRWIKDPKWQWSRVTVFMRGNEFWVRDANVTGVAKLKTYRNAEWREVER